MRIRFCDLCNESVPLTDLDHGRAVERGGRTICARCEASMAERDAERKAGSKAAAVPGGEVRPRRAGRGGGPAIALAVVALVFALGAALFLLERTDANARALAVERGRIAGELDAAAAAVEERVRSGLESRVDAAYREARAAVDRVRLVELALEDGPAEGEERSATEALAARVAALEELLAQGGAPAGDGAPAPALGDGVQPARADDLARLEREVGELRLELARLRGSGTKAGSEAAAPAPGEDRPPWWPKVAELASHDSGKRWSAVQALERTGDPRAAEHLIPLLADPDLFVRMATCRALGELRALIAVPGLIDALEDAQQSVRESAVGALRSLTGQSFRFDPSASAGERARRVAAWRAWWEEAKDELLVPR